MSIKSVNALSPHRLDYRPCAFEARSAGSPSSPSAPSYCLVPWLWHRKALYSQRLVE
ncbi:MAG: hypothetical protein R3D01_04400 [Hyphomicrobiales bacterium]